MKTYTDNTMKRSNSKRGAVTIELAIAMPVLTLLLLGTIDVGQFANAYQNISDASREGAQVAARTNTTSTQVRTTVTNYLTTSLGDAALADLTVQVKTSNGALVEGNLDAIPSGSHVQVEVIFPYEQVRVFPGLPQLTDQNLQATCVMLRQ